MKTPIYLDSTRRSLILGAAGVAMLGSLPARAQAFPNKPIHLVIGYPPGSSSDAMARALSQPLSEELGVPVVVESRAGAGGSVGAAYVARSTPDGYTLYYGLQDANVILPLLKRNAPYTLEKDFQPIGKVVELSLVLATNPALNVDSVSALVAEGKRRPGELKFASAGIGSLHQLAAEMLMQRTGIKCLHVPYQGGGPAGTGLLRGDVDFMFGSETLFAGHINSGRLTGLAIPSTKRSARLPNVPTMQEAGVPDFHVSAWYGILAPAGLPEPVAQSLERAVLKAARSGQYAELIQKVGGVPDALGRSEFAQFLKQESSMYQDIIKRAGIEQSDY